MSSHVTWAKFGGTCTASVLRLCALADDVAGTRVDPVGCWCGRELEGPLCCCRVPVLGLSPLCCEAFAWRCGGFLLFASSAALVPSFEVGSSLGVSGTRMGWFPLMAGLGWCCSSAAAAAGCGCCCALSSACCSARVPCLEVGSSRGGAVAACVPGCCWDGG